jgi:hypothetical protein
MTGPKRGSRLPAQECEDGIPIRSLAKAPIDGWTMRAPQPGSNLSAREFAGGRSIPSFAPTPPIGLTRAPQPGSSWVAQECGVGIPIRILTKAQSCASTSPFCPGLF